MTRSVHLLVLVHGMWGNPGHLAEVSRIIQEQDQRTTTDTTDETHLEVLVAQTNRDESTYDGIDWGGERIADEIDAKAKDIEDHGGKLVKFSITGYSLGGLLARYVIGILHQRHFFDTVTPINFNTFATPHIGLLRYPSFFSKLSSILGPKLLSRTGEQFYGVDHWSAHNRPLLEVMADRNRIFYQALALFSHITIYANAVNDTTVPYATAALESVDPFANHDTNGVKIEFDPDYNPLIKSYSIPEFPPSSRKQRPRIFSIDWFRSVKPSRLLPPSFRFQFRFPFNIVLFILIPILVPTFITLALVRLSLASRSSRARILLLEKDETSRSTKLINIFANLEKGVEDVMVDMMDDVSDAGSGTTTPINGKIQPSTTISDGSKKTNPTPEQPILTPSQLAMITSLNALPNLRKQIAFIDPARNSHAVIVCRDVKRFELHKRGEGVVRHWADNFIR